MPQCQWSAMTRIHFLFFICVHYSQLRALLSTLLIQILTDGTAGDLVPLAEEGVPCRATHWQLISLIHKWYHSLSLPDNWPEHVPWPSRTSSGPGCTILPCAQEAEVKEYLWTTLMAATWPTCARPLIWSGFPCGLYAHTEESDL